MDAASISGMRLADSSGNHNDGTLVGFSSAASAPGRFGDALAYPAAGAAYVSIPHVALNETPGGTNSVSLWFFYPSDRISNDALVLLPDAPRLDLWFTRSKYLCINTGNGDCWGVEDTALLGRWVHVVAVFVNGPIAQGKLYVDGQSRSSSCVVGVGFNVCDGMSATAKSPVLLGAKSDYPFHGMLDEVRIYNRELTGGEVTMLYSGTVCP
jgi:hypothetical protein